MLSKNDQQARGASIRATSADATVVQVLLATVFMQQRDKQARNETRINGLSVRFQYILQNLQRNVHSSRRHVCVCGLAGVAECLGGSQCLVGVSECLRVSGSVPSVSRDRLCQGLYRTSRAYVTYSNSSSTTRAGQGVLSYCTTQYAVY